eukprot:6535718-Prymnesium_polylepis.1
MAGSAAEQVWRGSGGNELARRSSADRRRGSCGSRGGCHQRGSNGQDIAPAHASSAEGHLRAARG